MEGISVSVCKGLKHCWNMRRGYHRLNGSGRRRRRIARAELGSTTRTRDTRFWRWRIKISPKIRIRRIPSPKKMLIWLRDAYVRMMLGLANSRIMTSSTGFGGPYSVGFGGAGGGGPGFGPAKTKEYDEKVLVQIYKSFLMTQGQLIPSETTRIASEISSRGRSL
ncbi:hypothetical protein PIB30_059319 [Stylosanthes scabra]|uniref:Uncharacterized protein n=1 Tax=Stylosanthes scabra TaxID=79078 RepID=A0ABU6ZJ00_9FABA|nr:hypothetical protein [Stylosanthes scabra]